MRLSCLLILIGILPLAAAPPGVKSAWSGLHASDKGIHTLDPDCRTLADFRKFLAEPPLDHPDASLKEYEVGTLGGAPVLQFDKSYKADGSVTVIKSILLRRGFDEYCLLYQQRYLTLYVIPSPARIFQAGNHQVLATRDVVTGTGAQYLEFYWTLGPSGPIRYDTSAIKTALDEILPAGSQVSKGYGLDVEHLCYKMPVWRPGDPGCCASGGAVALRLALEEDRIVVVSREFRSGSELTYPHDHSCQLP